LGIQIALHLIANKLQGSENAEAVVIDTTGTFDVFRLHQIAMSKLTSRLSDDEKSAKAEQLLHRLKIMRVFDFDGMLEAVTEVERDLAIRTATPKAAQKHKKRGKETGEIPDSEEEDLSDECEEVMEITAVPSNTVEMLVIDNLTSVATPLLKSNHVQGKSRYHLLLLFLQPTARSSITNRFLSSIIIQNYTRF
jgi:RecA/RadA recombinase